MSKGSNTPSFDNITIDGITLDKLIKIKDLVVSGQYKMGITKRIYIPKANGKLRPLGIPPFYDRIVQEVVRTILQIIYEPMFSNHSHGFRPGRSCHSALRHIRQGSANFTWAIEGDIKGFFDNINHTILLNLLNKKIKDPRFVGLISDLIKVIVKEDGKPSEFNMVGSPQGSILSPLLSNIYLHEFDKFMEEYILKFNKGKTRKTNPAYKNYKKKKKALRDQGIKEARKIGYSIKIPRDNSYRRMNYVRYADDFFITIIGSKADAVEIKKNCSEFLDSLNLTLSEEKTLITNPKDRPVAFLGYLIQNSPYKIREYSRRYHGI